MNTPDKADADDLERLWAKIRMIKFAMLTSEDGDELRSRPMVASQSGFDGTLWFFTHAGAHKVTEVEHDHRVNVSYADPDNQVYVSLSGLARIEQGREAIDRHWSDTVARWFPKGKDDPEVALLRVDVTNAEYWDAPASRMVRAWKYAKSAATGKTPDMGESVKLKL
jgi:general stress protein 26